MKNKKKIPTWEEMLKALREDMKHAEYIDLKRYKKA